MTCKVTFRCTPTHVHATVTGINSRENVARYLEQIRDECQNHGCTRVLIEERLDGPRLDTVAVYQAAAAGSARASGQFDAIAFVDVNAGQLMPFAETVAVNRGLPVRLLASVSEAEPWLLGLAAMRTDGEPSRTPG
jgi:hypothetical protein